MLPPDNAELGNLFLKELAKRIANRPANSKEAVDDLHRLMALAFTEATRRERIAFSTLFARITYAAHEYGMPRRLVFYTQYFRRQTISKALEEVDETTWEMGAKVCYEVILALFKPTTIPTELETLATKSWPEVTRMPDITGYKRLVRMVLTADKPDVNQFVGYDNDRPGDEVFVQYHLADRNENFTPTVKAIQHIIGFPVTVHLWDVEIDQDGVYRPAAVVIEPDYLMDVSSVAQCFGSQKPEPIQYLLNKFIPSTSSLAKLLGNVANFFLDELLHNPEADFRTLMRKAFAVSPLGFSMYSDDEIKEMRNKAQAHFMSIHYIVHQALEEKGVKPEEVFLEPTFYSAEMGLQGRLDLFYRHLEPKQVKTVIAELKSGSVFMPNAYGISHSHFIQTLLYDLLIRSTFGEKTDPASFIIYSRLQTDQMKFAPRVKSEQYEAIQVRNLLLAMEYSLASLDATDPVSLEHKGTRLFSRLLPTAMPGAKGILKTLAETFEKAYSGLSVAERMYLYAFAGFIAREQRLAKTGDGGNERVSGQAGLWLSSDQEKIDRFSLLLGMEFYRKEDSERGTILVFRKPDGESRLANFRVNDIVVIYPGDKPPLENQLIKGTIVALVDTEISIELRARMFNHAIFEENKIWNIETDIMDSGFTALYRSMVSFAQASPTKRAWVLGVRPPELPWDEEVTDDEYPFNEDVPDFGKEQDENPLTQEQHEVFQRIIRSRDYFLLWGPPGTGKTSIMLKHLVSYWLENTDEDILLLAFTNRAVDEICESIESIGSHVRQQYIRLGTGNGCDPRFRPRLLGTLTETVETRQGLKELIQKQRLVVGTVAAMQSKSELLQLKRFQRLVIDEASQLIEPMLVGLLPHFEHVLLIGDHKQLPAVVVQPPEQSQVAVEALLAMGLLNMRNSLFERLYKRCQDMQWDWAFGQLSHQGRMHRDIMAFPNEHFYEGTLRILPSDMPESERQTMPLQWPIPLLRGNDKGLETYITRERVLFIPVASSDERMMRKVNEGEAEKVVELICLFDTLYAQMGLPLTERTIGVITPYRAQIAYIRSRLALCERDYSHLTIDTVERYQGGARDIIIISLCANSLTQLDNLVSSGDDGVDRKLNVALTRARQQLILVGDPDILKHNSIYADFIERYGV